MAIKQFTNNASTTLAAPITASATSLAVVSGGGAQFPSLTGNQNFTATLVSAAVNLAVPAQSAASTSTTGGALAAATYYYVVTALGYQGETTKSNEQSVTTTGTTSSNTITWGAVAGATGYRVYRGTASGSENVYYTVSSGTTLSLVDTGAAATSGSPPTVNTAIAVNGNPREIVLVTGSPSSDNFTIVRAQEGTTAAAWNAGDTFTLLNTAGDMAAMAQADDVQAQKGNYALDTGSANAYVANFSPAITAYVAGVPLRVKIANANTSSTVTFNGGAGALSAYLPGGALPAVGALLAGGIATFMYDGTGFQIVQLPTNITGLEQTIANLLYPVGAYLMVESDTFNPNASFTWQTWVEVQGYVLVGRQPSTPQFASTGNTGGEITHQLVPAEVPPLKFQDFYYPEKSSVLAQRGASQYVTIGSLNNNIGSESTDSDNDACLYANKTTLSGTNGDGTGGATGHNNLQPYRVVRMWRRTA